MKDYKKFIKEVAKNKAFAIIKTSRKSTIKIVHKLSGKIYSVHPGDKAIQPLKNWIKKCEH